MADYRVVLAQLPSKRAAAAAAKALGAAYAEHLAADRHEPWRGEISEPLREFARTEGFSWGDDDRFTFDGDEQIEVGTVGSLLVVYHAAAMQLADIGLRAFARARGATATAFWDPDPTPLTLRLSLPKAAGVKQAFAAACDAHDIELELVTKTPDADTLLVIEAGTRTYYAAIRDRLGVADVLESLGRLPGIDATLELPAELAAPAPGPDVFPAELHGQIRRAAFRIMAAARSAGLPPQIAEDAIACIARATGEPLSRDALELGVAALEVPPANQRAIDAQPNVAWKLAAASALTQRELAMTATAHGVWLKTAKPPHRWRVLDIAGISLPIYDGPAVRHASFALRDARKLSFAGRTLVAASFAGALLDEADFTNADLSHACFAGASLRGAKLDGAELDAADFTAAQR